MATSTPTNRGNPLGNASTFLGQKGKRNADEATSTTSGAKARDALQDSNSLFVSQAQEGGKGAGSESGETCLPVAKRQKLATVRPSIEDATQHQTKCASTETLKAVDGLHPDNADSVSSTPSSGDDDEVEVLEHLPKTGIARSHGEFGKAIRGEALEQCRVLEKVFATRLDKSPKKLHLAFRGASVKLEKSNTLERLRTNLKMEVKPFLGDALSVATSECETYNKFCQKEIHDFLDDRQFKKVILSRSEAKLKAVKKAKAFVEDLLLDLEGQRRALLREKIPAAASGPGEYINLT